MIKFSRENLWRIVNKKAAMPLMLSLAAFPIPFLMIEDSQTEGLRWIEYFAIAVLSFFPGWLFIRFIKLRGTAIWQEYVIQLHRLGADRREYLPRPPVESEYYLPWLEAREDLEVRQGLGTYREYQNLYNEKFNAYYGRNFLEAVESDTRRPRTETLFPVLLCTTVFSIAWSGILSSSLGNIEGQNSWTTALSFGFAGAYLFSLQMLIRRFFQSDLKSSAYASAFARVVAVLLIVSVVHQVWIFGSPGHEAVAAFVIGFFPVVGLQALQRTAQIALRVAVPSLQTSYPLSELDGVNLWYETRLLEEGIEDQEELVTANIADVILHTRVPVGRLIDWLDQAHLHLHLPPAQPSRKGSRSRRCKSAIVDESEGMQRKDWLRKLRGAGIRNASELLVVFGVYHPHSTDVDGPHSEAHISDDKTLAKAKDIVGEREAKLLIFIISVLQNNTALTPVLNWRHWGAKRLFELESGITRDEPTGARAYSVKRFALIANLTSAMNREKKTADSVVLSAGPSVLVSHDDSMLFPNVLLARKTAALSRSARIFSSDVLGAVEVIGEEAPGSVDNWDQERARLMRAYGSAGVRFLWILDLRYMTLCMFELEHQGDYRLDRTIDANPLLDVDHLN